MGREEDIVPQYRKLLGMVHIMIRSGTPELDPQSDEVLLETKRLIGPHA